MLKQWLTWLNLGIAGMIFLLLLAAGAIFFVQPQEIVCIDSSCAKRPLPQTLFNFPKTSYDAIGKNSLELKFSPLTMQVPDLRNHLIYYGKNGRPDAQTDRPVLHFGFAGNPQIFSVLSGDRLYLKYDKGRMPPQYISSQQNSETPLWIEATPHNNEAIIKVSIKNEHGEIVRDPASHAQITLPEKESARVAGKTWEIGKWRVDGGLLARQKTRWVGPDLFLERHGGEDFNDVIGKHRIDFTDEENTYSVFVGLGDSLIWSQDRWNTAKPGEDTLGFPLMVIKKIEERVMNFELWDIGGKNKIVLNLIKMHEPWMPFNIQENFKFLGARTRSQYIFEIDGERILISPRDWLLQTEEGWIKLNKAQDIDDYVERKHAGILIVFDGLERSGGRQILKGFMFNPSRTEMQELEISVQKSGASMLAIKADDYEDAEDDDDDDDEDDDDEEEDKQVIQKVRRVETAIKKYEK